MRNRGVGRQGRLAGERRGERVGGLSVAPEALEEVAAKVEETQMSRLGRVGAQRGVELVERAGHVAGELQRDDLGPRVGGVGGNGAAEPPRDAAQQGGRGGPPRRSSPVSRLARRDHPGGQPKRLPRASGDAREAPIGRRPRGSW
jgi:hypothetical protein